MNRDLPKASFSIEIDEDTAKLLGDIAKAESDDDMALLTIVIAHKEQFLEYLQLHKLGDDEAANFILGRIASLRTE